jgi:AbrB family looped-hinge helix DNA binding protein
MAKVTSKLQVTIPKRIADRYGIRPGDEIDWVEAGDTIRVLAAHDTSSKPTDTAQRLELFDAATERQRARDADRSVSAHEERGWTRAELYARGLAG